MREVIWESPYSGIATAMMIDATANRSESIGRTIGAAARFPPGYEDTFGTYRLCLRLTSGHWHTNRGHLADPRRAAGLERMWV